MEKKILIYWISLVFFIPKVFAQDSISLNLTVSVNGVNRVLTHDSLFLSMEDDDIVIDFLNKKATDTLYCQWSNIDKTLISWILPSIRYTNIKGGSDSFMVWSDRKQQTLKKKLYINTAYAFGEKTWTWYAIGFYFVIIASAIAFFWIIYYNMQQQKMQRVRNQISDDLHDEVGASLSGIGIFAKLLRKRFAKDNAEMQTVIDNIIETSSFSVQNLRDSVWAINPQNDTMEKLFGRMCSFASELLNAKDIKVTFNPSIEETEVLLQKINIKMEQRRAIYLIFKEIVHNILKHSEATETTIEVKKVRFGVELVIMDNGKGFDLSKADEGNGMKTLQSRAKAALIDLKIDTKLGQGTAVKLFIPEI
jgi:hypothetical protein